MFCQICYFHGKIITSFTGYPASWPTGYLANKAYRISGQWNQISGRIQARYQPCFLLQQIIIKRQRCILVWIFICLPPSPLLVRIPFLLIPLLFCLSLPFSPFFLFFFGGGGYYITWQNEKYPPLFRGNPEHVGAEQSRGYGQLKDFTKHHI